MRLTHVLSAVALGACLVVSASSGDKSGPIGEKLQMDHYNMRDNNPYRAQGNKPDKMSYTKDDMASFDDSLEGWPSASARVAREIRAKYGAPDGITSFVLIVHDLDAAGSNGVDDYLHWMVWNIPATATSLAQGIPQGPELPDGTRQISASGPYYRGPGAPASGPAHH